MHPLQIHRLVQGLTNGPVGKPGPQPAFMNKVLLERSHGDFVTYRLELFLHDHTGAEQL